MDDSGSNNSKMAAVEAMTKRRDLWVASALALVTLLLFYFSIKATQWHFDYTSRIASGPFARRSRPSPTGAVLAQTKWFRPTADITLYFR